MLHKHPPVQIVDEDDNVIGAMSRDEAQKTGQINRISRVMLENSERQILLQKRSSNIAFPNLWDNSAAGHVDEGEDYEQAMRREIHEELGIKDIELQEIAHYYQQERFNGLTLKRFNKLYKGEIDFTPMDFNRDEVSEVTWFYLGDIKKLIFEGKATKGLKKVIEDYYR